MKLKQVEKVHTIAYLTHFITRAFLIAVLCTMVLVFLVVSIYFGDLLLNVNNYQITNKYFYNYEKCLNNSCNTYKDIVDVDYSNSGVGSILLILNYNMTLDLNSTYASYIKSDKGFFNNYLSVSYEMDGTEYNSSVINRTPTNLNNVLVLQVSSKIKDSSQVKIKFTIRNKTYVINLLK